MVEDPEVVGYDGVFSILRNSEQRARGRCPNRSRPRRRKSSSRAPAPHNLKNVDVSLPVGPARHCHGRQRIGQVVPRLRHHLCRGAAPLRRVAVRLRPPVPGADGEARRRPDRRHLPGHRHPPEEQRPQPALDGRHDHRDPRLHAAALGARRPHLLPQLRPGGRCARRPRSWRGDWRPCRTARGCCSGSTCRWSRRRPRPTPTALRASRTRTRPTRWRTARRARRRGATAAAVGATIDMLRRQGVRAPAGRRRRRCRSRTSIRRRWPANRR